MKILTQHAYEERLFAPFKAMIEKLVAERDMYKQRCEIHETKAFRCIVQIDGIDVYGNVPAREYHELAQRVAREITRATK